MLKYQNDRSIAMTVEELRSELGNTLSNLADADFGNIDTAVMEKLDEFAAAAGELNMKEGKRLIENLSKTMKAIQEGTSNASSGNLRLTALDFYLKKHSAGGTVEDL